MSANAPLPKLYTELASWWLLLSPPEEYEEEAGLYRQILLESGGPTPRTLLELGSGGGSNAFHLKADFQMTLVDLSPGMLAVSRGLNPECEHLEGDMRDVRLGRLFDAVFIHDAICYMRSLDDLRQALLTAWEHLRPGGVALFTPDYVRENFQPGTNHGGHDSEDGRALRYLEWIRDHDPSDSTYIAEYVYLLQEGDGSTTAVHDRHVEGLFSQVQWMEMLAEIGFAARTVDFRGIGSGGEDTLGFIARKPPLA